MKIQELENKLIELQVPKRWYSINGSINSDIHVLNKITKTGRLLLSFRDPFVIHARLIAIKRVCCRHSLPATA